MRRTLLLFIATLFFGKTQAQESIPLYQNIPNSIPGANEETSSPGVNISLSKVSVPTLSIFLPPAAIASGAAVIICPGGGYSHLAFGHEGIDVAKEFNKAGIAAFVLKYRLPSDKIMPNKEIGPLQDAQQAIKVVRLRAAEWKVDPAKVGIMGFSAGGHLAASAAAHYSSPVIENGGNLRPDFQILIYPVISFTDEIGHIGSRDNLLGKNPSAEKIKYYSNEMQINPQSPPAFIMHAEDDKTVKVENSLRMYSELAKYNIPSELIVYPKGGHGFGMNNKTTPDKWMDKCINWMRSNNWAR